MSTEVSIEGRDCMVEAVVSAIEDESFRKALTLLRVQQMEGIQSFRVNPEEEADNLAALYGVAGQAVEILLTKVGAVNDLLSLMGEDKDVFVGLDRSTDEPAHIHHVDRVENGEILDCLGRKVSWERLLAQQMSQGVFLTFIVEREEELHSG